MRLNKFQAFVAVGLMLPIGSASAWMSKDEKLRFDALNVQVEGIDSRTDRLERLIENSNLQQMFLHTQSLDKENRRLRGTVEELNHQIEQMKQRQRELYLDMDKRLQAVESRGSSMMGSMMPDHQTDHEPIATDTLLDEQSQYSQAFELLKSGQHQSAIQEFQKFLQNYPDSGLAANAQYWLGEAHYGARQYEQAVREFETVRTTFAGSAKVPDASLKLAYSYYELKQWNGARSVLQEIIDNYPDTSVARLASDRLKRMKREGH